jgi:hypothetical protein
MRYHFRMNLPGEQIKWRILETDGSGPLLAATYNGQRPLDDTVTILGCLLQLPLLTWKIVGGIHYEALKLWLKGVRYVPRPAPLPQGEFRDQASSKSGGKTVTAERAGEDGGGCIMKTEATWNEPQAVESSQPTICQPIFAGLPAKAKMALRGLMHMAHGRLSIRMPDGRMVLIEGRSEGPDATLILHNWNLAHQALTGGTIGVAESYMDGDWESPDVTAFLELFLVNVEVGTTWPAARAASRLSRNRSGTGSIQLAHAGKEEHLRPL